MSNTCELIERIKELKQDKTRYNSLVSISEKLAIQKLDEKIKRLTNELKIQSMKDLFLMDNTDNDTPTGIL